MSVYTIFPPRGIVDPKDSAAALLYGPPSEKVFLPFDCTVSEAPEFTATPTQTLVEDAKTISDHVVVKPLRLKVEAIISDTPLKGTPFASAIADVSSTFAGTSPSKKAYDYIKALYANQAVFDFVGGFEVYQNVVISDFRPTRTAEIGSALSFSMTLEQILIVTSQVLVHPGNTKAQSKVSHGGQPLQQLSAGNSVYDSARSVTPTASTVAGSATSAGSSAVVPGLASFPDNSAQFALVFK